MIELIIGDCRKEIKKLKPNSIDSVITSPPYFGLRDYGMDNQIGLEKDINKFIEELCSVFDDIKRVLKPEGTVWLNLGDSYSGSGKGPSKSLNGKQHHLEHKHGAIIPDGLKAKDLIGVPWRVAFALQARGWFLRQDIIWSKPNPMPESVSDRCTKAHEYIFLLSKSKNYYFDNEAIKEDSVTKDANIRDRDSSKLNNTPGRTRMGGLKHNNYDKRNKRSVWNVALKPYRGAHFATYPVELIEPCILAGAPRGGGIF